MNALAARILVVVALMAGAFGMGYYAKSEVVLAGQAKEAKAAVKQTAQNVVVAVAESGRIETEVAKVDTNVASIKAAIVKRGVTLHPKQEPKHATAPDSTTGSSIGTVVQPAATEGTGTAVLALAPESACSGTGPFYLDLGTVGLLNAARQGLGVGAAGGSNEAQSAPSTVEVTDLVGNDLDIVQMYLDLAKRHDELVDSVEKHLKEQAR